MTCPENVRLLDEAIRCFREISSMTTVKVDYENRHDGNRRTDRRNRNTDPSPRDNVSPAGPRRPLPARVALFTRQPPSTAGPFAWYVGWPDAGTCRAGSAGLINGLALSDSPQIRFNSTHTNCQDRAAGEHAAMGHIITHACGHGKIHHLAGYARQQEQKAKWLETTRCRECFIADKQAVQAEEAERDVAAVAHLTLPELSGSDRQVSWATSLRAARLLAMTSHTVDDVNLSALVSHLTDAKWWIDGRGLTNVEWLKQAEQIAAAKIPVSCGRETVPALPVQEAHRVALPPLYTI